MIQLINDILLINTNGSMVDNGPSLFIKEKVVTSFFVFSLK